MPPPTLKYLASSTSIAHAVVNFLTALAFMNGGVREILPFVRYISQFMDFEWSAIKSQDKGKGVVCAATWLMPAAMVPRPWDFPDPPTKKADGKRLVRKGTDDLDGIGRDLLDINPPPPAILPTLVVTPPTVKGTPSDENVPADVTTEGTDVPDASADDMNTATTAEASPGDHDGVGNTTIPSKEENVEPAVLTSSVTAPTNQVPP